MLYFGVVFLVMAIVAGLFGLGGIAMGAMEMAQVMFLIFLGLFVVSLAVGLVKRGS